MSGKRAVADPAVKPLSEQWALCVEESNALSVGGLRLRPGLVAGLHKGSVWIRGDGWSDETWQDLRSITGIGCYFVLADQQIVPIGKQVPVGRLPVIAWRPLDTVLAPQVQLAALPGELSRRVELRIVRTDVMRDPGWLLASMAEFCNWALSAPLVRLSRLSFACATDERCIVRGEPLPPIPGTRLVVQDGVTVPVGFNWQPSVAATTVRETLRLKSDQFAVWFADGHWETLAENDFVRATRAAVRQTASPATRFRTDLEVHPTGG